MVVVGSLRAPRPVAASDGDSSAAPSIPAVPETPPPSRRQRARVPDAALLLLLAIAGLVVWYSKLPTDFRFLDLREWVKVHILH